MFKRILAAVDGSSASDEGLKSAIALAADQHASLFIVHVIDDMAVAPSVDGGLFPAEYFDRMMEEMRTAGRRLLAASAGLAHERGVEAQTRLIEMFGQSVAQTIVTQAREQKADVIVLGTHGRRGLRRLVLESDAEAVLRESAVPVLLVRGPEQVNPDTRPARRGGRPW